MAAICNICGLPDELCICQEIAKEQQRAILSTDRRRYGKIVTKVEGIEDSAIDINKLAKILKNKCAAGGTVKGRTIELQGDHLGDTSSREPWCRYTPRAMQLLVHHEEVMKTRQKLQPFQKRKLMLIPLLQVQR